MSLHTVRDTLRANGLELWARFALHAFLKFMLPPGLSPEVAVTWARHVIDLAPLFARTLRARAALPALAA